MNDYSNPLSKGPTPLNKMTWLIQSKITCFRNTIKLFFGAHMFWQQSLHQIALKGSNTCHHVAMRKDFGGNTVGVFYKQTFQQALSFQPLFLFQHLYFSAKMKRQHISFSLACCEDMIKKKRMMRKSVEDSKFFWTTEHLNIFIFTCLSCSWCTTGSVSSLSPRFGVLCHTHTNINADANAQTQTAAYQEAF